MAYNAKKKHHGRSKQAKRGAFKICLRLSNKTARATGDTVGCAVSQMDGDDWSTEGRISTNSVNRWRRCAVMRKVNGVLLI